MSRLFGKKGEGETESATVAETPVLSPKLGKKLNDFELQTTLGTGTFGRVRLCKDKADGAYYALKILRKAEIIRLKQVEHIKSEVALLSKISHPFIVNLLSFFQDPEKVYMVIEYVPGGELFSYLRREGRLSNDSAKFYAAEIVLAFAHCHSHNIVYRDLKPENLLITSTGHLKITDFGFAKIVEDRTWTLCGTPEYLAPEIIQSKGHGKSVDWWALGILIYEMLAGYPPFFDENPFGIYQKILFGKIDFPPHFNSKAKDLIKRLLTADRTKRIGCLRNGADDIKKHRWFSTYTTTRLSWTKVYNCELKPPYIPPLASEGDTQHFDPYPDSIDEGTVELDETDKEHFTSFEDF